MSFSTGIMCGLSAVRREVNFAALMLYCKANTRNRQTLYNIGAVAFGAVNCLNPYYRHGETRKKGMAITTEVINKMSLRRQEFTSLSCWCPPLREDMSELVSRLSGVYSCQPELIIHTVSVSESEFYYFVRNVGLSEEAMNFGLKLDYRSTSFAKAKKFDYVANLDLRSKGFLKRILGRIGYKFWSACAPYAQYWDELEFAAEMTRGQAGKAAE